MKNDFDIYLENSDIQSNFIFGVFSGTVNPPATCNCKKNDRKFSRFFYVVQGEIIFNKNSADMICASKGSIIYLPNNITYKSEWSKEQNGKFISVNFILNEFYVKLPDKICIAAFDTDGIYLDIFTHAYDVWLKGAPGYKLEILSEIYRILYSLFVDLTYRRIKSKHRAIYKGILYIENHYLEEIQTAELAAMCHTSETNFRRLFKEYKKMSPITYKNYLKVKKASELLRTGEYTVTEAANSVNIPDICYFYKLFKKFFDTTPKTFIP